MEIDLDSRRDEYLPRTVHKYREQEDFARVEITPNRLDMEVATMVEPEVDEQVTISELPENVAHSLARHGIISFTDEKPEENGSPLRTVLRTPSKQ